MQEKYSTVVNEIDAASSEKANLQSELTGIQDKIAKEKKQLKSKLSKWQNSRRLKRLRLMQKQSVKLN